MATMKQIVSKVNAIEIMVSRYAEEEYFSYTMGEVNRIAIWLVTGRLSLNRALQNLRKLETEVKEDLGLDEVSMLVTAEGTTEAPIDSKWSPFTSDDLPPVQEDVQ